MDQPLLCFCFAAFALSAYVLLDGFDLGVGALLLVERDEARRDRMVDCIAPTWDGNETWLIMAGVTLLAAFPVAYGVLLPAFYLPLILMLLSLGFRGVSFEFRYQASRSRRRWDAAFAVGSVVAAVMQGIVIGGLVQGVAVGGTDGSRAYAGGPLDWLTPFTCLTGLAVLAGYVTLGAGWLRLKGEEATRALADRVLSVAPWTFAALFIVGHAWAAHAQPGLVHAWRRRPVIMALSSVLFLAVTIGIGLAARRSRARRLLPPAPEGRSSTSPAGEGTEATPNATASRPAEETTISWSDRWPFFAGLAAFSLAAAGLLAAVFPDVVPFRLTLWQAASGTASTTFLLVGAAVVTPVVLTYTAFAYYVFRGRTPATGWEA